MKLLKRLITFPPQTIQVDETLSIKAYYAGHVLGAAMFDVRVGAQSVVYTVSPEVCPLRITSSCPGRLQHGVGPAPWRGVD